MYYDRPFMGFLIIMYIKSVFKTLYVHILYVILLVGVETEKSATYNIYCEYLNYIFPYIIDYLFVSIFVLY